MYEGPVPHGKWISCLYRMSQCALERKLEPLGLGSGVFSFLMALYNEDGLSQEELRERLFFDKGTTARALAKLEARGLVRRDPDPDDGRVKRVRLTEEGRAAESPLKAVLKDWDMHQRKGVSAEDMEVTLKTLEKMGRNTAALMERKRTGNGS